MVEQARIGVRKPVSGKAAGPIAERGHKRRKGFLPRTSLAWRP